MELSWSIFIYRTGELFLVQVETKLNARHYKNQSLRLGNGGISNVKKQEQEKHMDCWRGCQEKNYRTINIFSECRELFFTEPKNDAEMNLRCVTTD